MCYYEVYYVYFKHIINKTYYETNIYVVCNITIRSINVLYTVILRLTMDFQLFVDNAIIQVYCIPSVVLTPTGQG